MECAITESSVQCIEGRIEGVWLKPPPQVSLVRRLSGLLGETSPVQQNTKDFVRSRAKGMVRVTSEGLVGSQEFHRENDDLEPSDVLKRAILVQSQAHLWKLSEHFPDYPSLREKSVACFGENLTVSSGLSADTVCIGDIFKVTNAATPSEIRLQVTGPRRPCYANDRKHGKGVRRLCAEEGLAGFFLRPLGKGEGHLEENSSLTLVSRPRPGWTLRRVSQTVYGRGVASNSGYNVSSWIRKQDSSPFTPEWLADLRELNGFEELPKFEWGVVIMEMLLEFETANSDDGSLTIQRVPSSPISKRSSSRRRSSSGAEPFKTQFVSWAGQSMRSRQAISWTCVAFIALAVPLICQAAANTQVQIINALP